MPKRTRTSSATQWKDWVKDKRAIMREFVGKSGRHRRFPLAIWFEDKTFAMFQKKWAEMLPALTRIDNVRRINGLLANDQGTTRPI